MWIGTPPSTTSYPTWNIAIGSYTQPAAYQNSDVSYSTITGSQPIASGIHRDGKKTYQKL
jgi:hypothetical protein